MRSIYLAMISQTWRLFMGKKAIYIGQSQGIKSKQGGLDELKTCNRTTTWAIVCRLCMNIWLVRVCMVNLSRSGLRTNNINQVHHLHQSAWSSTILSWFRLEIVSVSAFSQTTPQPLLIMICSNAFGDWHPVSDQLLRLSINFHGVQTTCWSNNLRTQINNEQKAFAWAASLENLPSIWC